MNSKQGSSIDHVEIINQPRHATKSTYEEPYVQWMWGSHVNPYDLSQTVMWSPYSDVETEIIEAAFQKKESLVLLDDCRIELSQFLQISNTEYNLQLPVQRCLEKPTCKPRIRKNRLQPLDSIVPKVPFVDENSSEEFVTTVTHQFDLTNKRFSVPSVIRMMVEKAAEGLIIEGTTVGKPREAEWLAEQLRQEMNSSQQKVWACCARLYSKDSFLYRQMNEIMRLVDDDDQEHEKLWKSKIISLGPFAWLLYWMREKDDLCSTLVVYRGATLPDDVIAKFKEANQNNLYCFQAFTSTTRSWQIADIFGGNVIFIINISAEDGIDIQHYSNFQDEEEILLAASFDFKIKSCEKVGDKWEIHLISFWSTDYWTSSSSSFSDLLEDSSLESDNGKIDVVQG
ncbi:unnamed protein product [Rotaria sp. Silwood2]|nr:unnamed protein product [Rotaria sp. Silwood2]CAF4377486.1 unnamed protein product [Rotaria sp. Silwood2]